MINGNPVNIDGTHVKGTYIRSNKQKIILPEGTHELRINCTYKAKGKTYLVGEKKEVVNIAKDESYVLAAKINLYKKLKNELYRCCKPIFKQEE